MLHIITHYDSYLAGQFLIRHMVEESIAHPETLFIAIVPEQATLQMQTAVVAAHPKHAVMNIDIVSFDRLAHNVFDELGVQMQSILGDTGKILLLRKVLRECREDLRLYRNKTRMPGFAEQIKSVITELKQYALDDNDLFLMQESAQRENNQILFDKLQDIRLIYRKFNEAIADKYTTQEEVPDVLARLVPGSGIIAGSRIYLDGFTGFTPIQYRLIGEFLRSGAEVTVSVTIPAEAVLNDDNGFMDQFSLSRKTLKKLQEIAGKSGTDCVVTDAAPQLGGSVSSGQKGTPPETDCFAAPDIRQEVRYIAGQILTDVREKNLRFRDHAVILSDMEAYHKTVEEVFAEAQIPCFIDHKKKLADNSLARFVTAAMQVALERFSYQSVFACLKTRMTDLDPCRIHELENYCLAFGIREASVWKKDFTKNKKRKRAFSGEETGECWDLQSLNESRGYVYELLSGLYETSRKKECRAGDYTEAMKQLLNQAKAQARLEEYVQQFYKEGEISRGKEYEQVFTQITGLLDQIRDLMGDEILTAGEFYEILTGALEEIQLSIIPPTLDAVPVGDLVRSRITRPHTLFLAGANEGRIPQKTASAGLLTASERSFLKQEKFELAPDELEDLYTQHFYLYLLFTRAEKRLCVTFACRNQAGEEMLASYILEHMEDILPGLHPVLSDCEPDSLWLEQGAMDLAEAAGRAFAGVKEGKPVVLTAHEQSLLSYFANNHRPRLGQILAGTFFSNRVLPLDEQTVLRLYGDELSGSVSRYERFYECPFRHFLDYGLRLQEREEYKVQASELGTVYHESLERYSDKLAEQGLTFRSVSDEVSDNIVREAVTEAASGMTGDILNSSGRNRYLLERMVQVTKKTADVLRAQVAQGAYEPKYFELPFDEKTSENTALRGKIDRVDIYDAGDIFVKIIDYKSGHKAFHVRDIYSGLQLQLTAYMDAAVKRLQKDHPKRTVRPGGIYYYLIQDKYVRTQKEADEKFCMSGLTNCDPQALEAVDEELGQCRESRIVPVQYTKNGALTARSVIANDEEFWNLIGFVRERITTAAKEIRAGNAQIHPYCDGSEKNACQYCTYQNVCKFESGKWGSDERELPGNLELKDIEKEIYGRDQVDKGAKGSH